MRSKLRFCSAVLVCVLAGVYSSSSQGPQTRPAPGGGRPPGGGSQNPGGGGRPPGGGGGRPPGGGNPGGGNRPGPGNPGGGNRPGPGNPGGPSIQPPRPNPGGGRPPNPGGGRPPNQGGGRPPQNRPPQGRPPQWGRPPQNRPSYNFRPNDRNYLRRYYSRNLGYINRMNRPRFVIGGFFPFAYIGYITPVPPPVYGYLPPPPPGYQMGYYDGYVVVYDPLTYFIANVVDLLQ